jgi:acetolactate synthase I/II/III large subunit
MGKCPSSRMTVTSTPGMPRAVRCVSSTVQEKSYSPVIVDETIVHSTIIRELLDWNLPHSFLRVPSGLGQGLGIALGSKLGGRERPVVMLIGDGSFLYNPVLPALTFAKDQNLPILVVIFNNNKYEVMRRTHVNWYPEGVSATEKLHYGVHIANADYSELVAWTGGRGFRVDKPTRSRMRSPMPMRALRRAAPPSSTSCSTSSRRSYGGSH